MTNTTKRVADSASVHRVEAPHKNESVFRDLFQNSPDAIFIEDPDGNVLDVNPAACRLHGMDRETLIGKNVLDLVPPDRREEVARDFPKLVNGELDHVEGHSLTEDGRAIPVELRVSRFQYAGQPALLLHVRDISELKQAEEKLRQRSAELAHMARVHDLGEMATTLAHEINQPLHAIMNYGNGIVRRLEEGASNASELIHATGELLLEAKRASNIIAHLRRLLGNREPRRSTVDVNDIIQELVRLTDAEAERRGIAVHLELADDLPKVVVDRIQIEQVVLNLVRNAFDAMSDIPKIQRRLTITTSVAEGQAIEIAVHDEGTGLSPDLADCVFDPFFTTKADGLGMGLAISRSIVEAHGGRIWASPIARKGATFRLTLPVCQTGRCQLDSATVGERSAKS
jgi:PAS domain S-box-containing protein